jgi:histidine triad (HIT) family protein
MNETRDPDCLFCKLVTGELDTEKVYEDDEIFVFNDIHPQAPVHWLIIPKRHIRSLNAFAKGDTELAGRLMLTARKLAEQHGLPGYRVAMNVESAGGQLIFHAHLHVLAGRVLKPTLG